MKSRVQDAILAQVEMQAHNTNNNPHQETSKTTFSTIPNDLKWTIYSYLNPHELTTLGYVSRSVQKVIFQDILAVLNRNLRSSITNLPLYVRALHLPEIPDVFDISLIKHDKLDILSLANSNITDIQLAQIIDRCPSPNLTEIYLGNCPRITDAAVKKLAAKYHQLTKIGLNDCQLITDAAVKELAAKCPQLTTIALDNCPLITDAAVKELAAKCPLLIAINLGGCKLITDAAVKELAAKCPQLTSINLGGCKFITDAAVKELAAKCSQLTMIGLNGCWLITDAAVKELAAKCPQLTTINLAGCQLITDAAIKELAAKYSQLTTIGLTNCPLITDAAVKELAAKCSQLKAIGLSSSPLITDVAVKELAAKCRLLTEIYLETCPRITDAAVKELAAKCPLLTKIYLSGTPITAISCIFLAKYSSKLIHFAVAPELLVMFKQYKQAFSYKPYTELGKTYIYAINDIFNQKREDNNNYELLNYLRIYIHQTNFYSIQHIESEILKKIDSLNEDDKNKFYVFVHQLAGSPRVSELLKWGKENHKANYARAADALHMLESNKMAAAGDKTETQT